VVAAVLVVAAAVTETVAVAAAEAVAVTAAVAAVAVTTITKSAGNHSFLGTLKEPIRKSRLFFLNRPLFFYLHTTLYTSYIVYECVS
jgi:hypothetical protein